MPQKKPIVYLAGPIAGCNQDQVTRWRVQVRDRWSDEFDFIDPTEELVDWQDHASHEIVDKDGRAIQRADAILANMWRESIGTAIGVTVARTAGKTVVVVDRNHLNSKILAYYADAVTDTVQAGMKMLRTLVRAQRSLRTVVKHGGDEEPFDREKLAAAIRAACRAAGRNDILAPAAILPLTLEKLQDASRVARGAVTTTHIQEAVWNALAELESDPLRAPGFEGIREVWERYDAARRTVPSIQTVRPAVRVAARARKARIFSGKSHTTIWGKAVKALSDVPRLPRAAFREILRVEGIAEIRLTKMKKGHADANRVRVEIHASRTEGLLEGKCYHSAEKGDVQMFQIKVHEPENAEAIRVELIRHLGEQGLLRIAQAD